MSVLHIDFETRSTVDLTKTGVYVYAEDPTTDVLCAAYAVDDGPVELWHPGKGKAAPHAIHFAAENPDRWTIVAHNANFERRIWAGVLGPRYGWTVPRLGQWRCTMAMALAMSLPASLANAAAAVGLSQGKDLGGRDLMLRMSKPRKAHKDEDEENELGEPIVYWFEDAERKARLYSYCVQDVEVERELERRLCPLSDSEQLLWQLDQKINDRGVYVDMALCKSATAVVEQATEWLDAEIHKLTEGAVRATTNIAQIHKWLRERGFQTASLDKDSIDEMLARKDLPKDIRRVLEIRREAAKASVKKIVALVAGRSADGRAKGLLQFHAAGTGRWAGRRFQPQNIKRPELDDIEGAIEAVSTGNADYVRVTYGEPLAVVGDCLRGMVRAAPGNALWAADFSNIEGRLQAWIAGEKWKLDAFRAFDNGTGHDIYHLMAAKILEKSPGPVDKPTITKAERQAYGKVPELALGYQGGVGAFQAMAVNYGVDISDERAEEIKINWRLEHPEIVGCWYDLERAGKSAINSPGKTYHVGGIAFKKHGSFLFMRLPSGRCIAYPYPRIKDKLMPWGETRPQIAYMGLNTYTRKWELCYAHGGLLFNNAVQGAARDVEAEAMIRVERAGYPNILNVHDEVVCETRAAFGSVEQYGELMTTLPAWAPGLPLAASAWTADRYRK